MDEAQTKQLERHYAHFHRVLSGLLTELSQEQGVVWLGERGHLLREHYQENCYRKALYPLQGLEPYEERLAELQGVQQQALAILGTRKPPHGLLLPQVVFGATFARLRPRRNYVVQRLSKAEALGKYQGKLQGAVATLEALSGHVGRGDAAYLEQREELRRLEAGLERLETSKEDAFREHFWFNRVRVSLYLEDGSMIERHVRDVGMILVGHQVEIRWADTVRRQRRTTVELEPLLETGPLQLFGESEWQEAAGRLKGS